ncbi:hypothetical protein Q9966_010560 [Columba livia]|nr:hypothetical protein Q9966_010560 [Columba livia]
MHEWERIVLPVQIHWVKLKTPDMSPAEWEHQVEKMGPAQAIPPNQNTYSGITISQVKAASLRAEGHYLISALLCRSQRDRYVLKEQAAGLAYTFTISATSIALKFAYMF